MLYLAVGEVEFLSAIGALTGAIVHLYYTVIGNHKKRIEEYEKDSQTKAAEIESLRVYKNEMNERLIKQSIRIAKLESCNEENCPVKDKNGK